MIKLTDKKVYIRDGKMIEKHIPDGSERENTISYEILKAHNTSGDMRELKIKFDALASHDITYVGIIQTARASGLKEFPIPYVLTNCHNSLCAVGGTINEDDHIFGLSAAKKYGGIFVPAHQSVIHSYMRECFAGSGKMILGSDSHTRYGALGTMAIGEGGPELVKQLLSSTYDITYPDVVAVRLTSKPKPGVGPHDVAIALVGATFSSGFVKNSVLEFIGEGIRNLSMDYRLGIDVMTTETGCLSSVWETDEKTKAYLELHNRAEDYKELKVRGVAEYDRMIDVDLSKIEPMIALPFHPSNAYTIKDFLSDAPDLLNGVEEYAVKELGIERGRLDLISKFKNGRFYADQGVIAGCAGGIYENLCAASDILAGKSIGNSAFGLSVYPASSPVMLELIRSGRAAELVNSGAILRTAFCGPCFGAGDVPGNSGLSIRHSTRNFPNREGSKPGEGQISAVALMDSRSIAATAANGGVLTPATEIEINYTEPDYHFDGSVYSKRVYNGYKKPHPDEKLVYGPNIADWPEFYECPEAMLLNVAALLTDPVTTTDELIPSGETSSYRSNPEKLSSFALSRKDPSYVKTAKDIRDKEKNRRNGIDTGLEALFSKLSDITDRSPDEIMIGTLVAAVKPGDGSAREQAASCQRVLGGLANIAKEYATKRYRSNLINWGMLPFVTKNFDKLSKSDWIFIDDVRKTLLSGGSAFKGKIINENGVTDIDLDIGRITDDERMIILKGCLINYNKR